MLERDAPCLAVIKGSAEQGFLAYQEVMIAFQCTLRIAASLRDGARFGQCRRPASFANHQWPNEGETATLAVRRITFGERRPAGGVALNLELGLLSGRGYPQFHSTNP